MSGIAKNTKCVVCALLLCFVAACAGQKTQTETPEAAPKEAPLAKKYANIVVLDIKSTPEIETDYPEAAEECRTNIITALMMKNTFKSVSPGKKSKYEPGTLLVKPEITEMRIVSTGARIWGGAFAGSSYMNIAISLIDADTNKVVRNKDLNSSNNAWGAAWSSGSTDRSLPSDMGKMIAAYVDAVVPQ